MNLNILLQIRRIRIKINSHNDVAKRNRIVNAIDAFGVSNQSSDLPNGHVNRRWDRTILPTNIWNFAQIVRHRLKWFATTLAKGNPNAQVQSIDTERANVIRVEINVDKIDQLIQEHQVCATDFRCLDCPSKVCIRQLFLKACSKRLLQSSPVNNER